MENEPLKNGNRRIPRNRKLKKRKTGKAGQFRTGKIFEKTEREKPKYHQKELVEKWARLILTP
jgi:hypothetical protein